MGIRGRQGKPRTSVALRALLIMALTGVTRIGAAQPEETVVEPLTETPFPVSLMPPGGAGEQWLTGTGLREVTVLFFPVHVYAFGLYVDGEGARAALSGFSGRSPAELAGDRSFYARLLDMVFAVSLRLVMVRTVAGGDVADAFDDSLRPRLAAADPGDGDAAAALDRFRGYFDAPEIATGTEIVFACAPSGRLTTTAGGDERAPIDSPALCRALFDVYLGTEPISVEGKKTVIAGFPELLSTATR